MLALIDGCLGDVVARTLEESCQAHASDYSTLENKKIPEFCLCIKSLRKRPLSVRGTACNLGGGGLKIFFNCVKLVGLFKFISESLMQHTAH